jgi:hypothetical protein
MYGYPKLIRTRADLEFLMGYLGTSWASAENVDRGLAFLRGLKEDHVYLFDRTLGETESPDGPDPDYIVLVQEDGARHQMRREADAGALISRLNLTKVQIDEMIKTVEEAH